jgi:hypothetical protein
VSLVANVIASSVGKAAAAETQSLTRDLHTMLQAAGWPMKLVLNIKVQLDGGKYGYFIPKAIENELYDLEFGDGTKKEGQHLLFSFLNNLQDTDLDNKTFQQLMQVGLV